MTTYKVKVPPTAQVGSYETIATANGSETARQNALWSYNKAREHDGLPPLKRLPCGTTLTPIS